MNQQTMQAGGNKTMRQTITFNIERDPTFQQAIQRGDIFKLRVILKQHGIKTSHEDAQDILYTYCGA